MSITPTEWSIKDATGLVPDVSLRQQVFFNTEDGCLYRIVDFIMVQEPGSEHQVYPEGRKGEVMPSYTAIAPGDKRWYVVLKDDSDTGARLAIRYADFDGLNNFHRVKSIKSQGAIRSIDIPEPTTPRIDVVRGGPRHDEPDARRRMVDVGRVADPGIGRTVELSSRQRPSSVDHSTGSPRGVVKGPRNVDPGSADFDHTGDSVMLLERGGPATLND